MQRAFQNLSKELTGNSDMQHCLWYQSPGAKQDNLSSSALLGEDEDDREVFFSISVLSRRSLTCILHRMELDSWKPDLEFDFPQ